MSINRTQYLININGLAGALKTVPDAQSLTIFRDGSCSIEFEQGGDETTVEMAADLLATLLDGCMQRSLGDEPPPRQLLPETEFFYRRALERSAEIKRGENL